MVDVPSAVIGGIVLLNVAALLYGAYLKGALDATEPEEIVDLGEVNAYFRQDAASNALRRDLTDDDGRE